MTILFSSFLFIFLAISLEKVVLWLRLLFGWVGYMFMYMSYGYAMAVMRALSAPESAINIMASFFGVMIWVTYFGTVILMLAGLIMAIQWVKRLMMDAKQRKFNAGAR